MSFGLVSFKVGAGDGEMVDLLLPLRMDSAGCRDGDASLSGVFNGNIPSVS